MSDISIYSQRFVFAVLVLLLTTASGGAQTPACGQPQLRSGDAGLEVRFLPFPVEHVRASVLRALPTLSARPSKEANGVIEAKIDSSLSGSASQADVHTNNGSIGLAFTGIFSKGTFYIGIEAAQVGGVAGTVLRIDSSGVGNYATPLADEVSCLTNLLSQADPAKNPRGLFSALPAASERVVSVPANTTFRVALRNVLSSKGFQNGVTDVKIESGLPVLEVIDDVAVDGVTVFRKGALVKGKLAEAKAAGRVQQGGSIELVLVSATSVDGQEIGIDGGTQKEQGRFKPGAQQQGVNSAVVSGGLVGGMMYALLSKGYEALIPAGTAYEVQLTQSATVKVQPEAITSTSSIQTVPIASQKAGADKSGSPSLPNLNGLWYWSSWGHLKLLQAAGERKLFGRAEGYDVDGIINDADVVLHYIYAGEVYYTIELDLTGDANTLSGKYSSGEMKAGSKTKSMVISRVLYASRTAVTDTSGLNVSGVWHSHDWGKIQLTQAAGQQEITGRIRGYDLIGFVSEKRVILFFLSAGAMSRSHALDYTAELTLTGDGTLSGRYSSGEMLANSKTKPIEMTLEK